MTLHVLGRNSLRFGLAAGVSTLALLNASPALAISWDDAGNSASKLWDDNGNWSPDGDPDGQPVFIGNFANAANDTTLMDRAYTITSLTISNGADVVNSTDFGATDDFELLVNGPTIISDAGSTFFVIGGDPDGLDTEGLTINSGGTLNLNSTTSQGTAVVEIESDLLDLNAGGTIIGQGRIDFDESVTAGTNVFRHNGTLTANTPTILIGAAPAAGTLRLNALDSDARWDWDGAGTSAVINVNGNQTLDVDISTGSDAWSAEMNLYTGSTLDMRDAWSMDSGTINVNTAAFGFIIGDPLPGAAASIDGANWTMSGGSINIEDTWDSLQLDSQLVASGGTIDNDGTIIFNGGATIQSGVTFNMNSNASSLEVNSAVNIDVPNFNLDGSEAVGNVTTINAGGNLDLDLGVGADISFGHTINMNGGELDVTTSAATTWQLNTLGEINVNGGVTSTINSAGETFQISGDINVGDNSTLTVNSASEYFASANVLVKAGSILNHGTATYSGGSFTGDGLLKKGIATIAADTTWDVGTVDIDDGSTTINDGANLVVNTNSIDDAGDGIDSTITIADTATLTVNLTGGADVVFDNAGRLTYNGNNVSSIFLPATASGSAYRFDSGSIVNINGDGTSSARIKLNGGTLNINDAAEDFRLEGGTLVAGSTNEITGGTINGPGELQAGSGHALRGRGTINAPVDFDGSAQLIATGGTLNVNGGIVDVGTIGTSNGTLDVSTAWNTNVTNNVVIAGGTLQGSLITNDGVNGISGRGVVSARVINNSIINANDGGTLTVNNTLNDWDGAANNGTLQANGGTLQLNDSFRFNHQGTVNAFNGTVFANGFELEFEPASNLNLTNGTYRSTSTTDFGGTITVNAGPASNLMVNGSATFEPTSNTTLNGDLVLDNPTTIVHSGATFSGGASLVVPSANTLRLLDGADVDVLIENNGTLDLGASPGQTSGLDFEQSGTGTWDLELGGTGINDYDRMTLTGIASLAGTLDVSLIGGFTPTLGDSFSILLAGSVIGTFDSVLGSPGAGLAYDVAYNANSVLLSVINAGLAGDLNNDGFVGVDDLNIVLVNWNQTVPPGDAAADPSGDNYVGVDDLNIVLVNWNNGTPPVDNTSIPEPASALLLGLGGLALIRRR